MTTLTIIVAKSDNNVIGYKNQLPWKIKADMDHFVRTTKGKAVVMGRKTYESIGKPLKDRLNLVLTKSQEPMPGVVKCHSLDHAVREANKAGYDELFVIGGSGLYHLAMPWVTKMIITEVHREYVGDAFFPVIPLEDWAEQFRSDIHVSGPNPEDDIGLSFVTYERTESTRPQVLHNVSDIFMHCAMTHTAIVSRERQSVAEQRLERAKRHAQERTDKLKPLLKTPVPGRDYLNTWTAVPVDPARPHLPLRVISAGKGPAGPFERKKDLGKLHEELTPLIGETTIHRDITDLQKDEDKKD